MKKTKHRILAALTALLVLSAVMAPAMAHGGHGGGHGHGQRQNSQNTVYCTVCDEYHSGGHAKNGHHGSCPCV